MSKNNSYSKHSLKTTTLRWDTEKMGIWDGSMLRILCGLSKWLSTICDIHVIIIPTLQLRMWRLREMRDGHSPTARWWSLEPNAGILTPELTVLHILSLKKGRFYSETPSSTFDMVQGQAGPAGMACPRRGGTGGPETPRRVLWVVTGFGQQGVGARLTRNWPPLPSSSSRMYPSAGTVDRGGCFQDSVALLLWVQHSSSCRMGVAGTGEEAKRKLV